MFSFIDLFSGIGGFRYAFESHGGKCVFSSEINKFARQTYISNFNAASINEDITKINVGDIPNFDVLLGGFPCQAFSIAGVSKRNSLSRLHGFKDTTHGTLFFDIARILHEKQPKAFLLENVKNLIHHDSGRTFATILDVLQNQLGYNVQWRVIDSRNFVPQKRKRVYIVGFRDENCFSFDNFLYPAANPMLKDILHKIDGSEPILSEKDLYFNFKKI